MPCTTSTGRRRLSRREPALKTFNESKELTKMSLSNRFVRVFLVVAGAVLAACGTNQATAPQLPAAMGPAAATSSSGVSAETRTRAPRHVRYILKDLGTLGG